MVLMVLMALFTLSGNLRPVASNKGLQNGGESPSSILAALAQAVEAHAQYGGFS